MRIPDVIKSFLAAVLFVAAVYFLNVYLFLTVIFGFIFVTIWAFAHFIMFEDGK